MPSFLSRIRHRGSSIQPSPHSVSTPPALASSDIIPNLEGLADVCPSPLIGLKIQPDLDSLLESYETENISPQLQSKNGSVTVPPPPAQDDYSHLPLKPHVSRNAPIQSPKFTLPTIPDPIRQPTFSIFAEDSPLGGTFGRQQSPLADLGKVSSGSSHHKTPTRSRSSGDAANMNQTSTGAQRPGWNPSPTNQLSLSETLKRSSSMRSLPNKKRRIERSRGANTRSLNSLRTNRPPSLATPRLNKTTPSLVHHSRSESLKTFGYSTPYSTHTFGHHESPPPPLPSLDHPELALIFDAQDSRSVTFDRPHKPSNGTATIPHVDNIFGIPQELTSGSSASRKPMARKHSKTLSVDSRRSSRRSSAEWSSVQATDGILTNSNSWQAQVSREILRLSFGESVVLPGAGDPGNNRGVSHVSAARHSPTETFILPRPPPLFGSPLFLQDSNSATPSPKFRGGDQAVVAGDEYDKHRRMTEQETPTIQVSNSPSDTKGKQPLKSSLRASSTRRYSAISTVLATPVRSDNPSSDSSVSKGKRKADEVDLNPPDQRSLHATFAVPEDLPLGKRPDLHAPSSFRAKRARLSTSSSPGPPPSRPDALLDATNTGTWTSTTSSKIRSLSRQQSMNKPPSSKTNSYRSDIPSERVRSYERYERTRSTSQLSHTSIPVSALVSPRAPSVSKSLTSAYHMRDPRRPPRVRPTPWSLRLTTEIEDGSPIHAWFFFLGFIIFPVWWLASVWRIPQTRSVGGSEVEKAVTLDDPQVEHDARTWRFRCRIMAGVSLITYIPFIVLVAIFAH